MFKKNKINQMKNQIKYREINLITNYEMKISYNSNNLLKIRFSLIFYKCKILKKLEQKEKKYSKKKKNFNKKFYNLIKNINL